MNQLVTITLQGQLTIPKAIREAFGMKGSTRAMLYKQGNTIVVEPKHHFLELAGSLRSKHKLTDTQLKNARQAFSKQWPRKIKS